MTIVFYKVNNSLNYGRHEFDGYSDKPKEILDMLQKLPEEEVKFYDSDQYSWQTKEPTLSDFETDYNDEELDGGWWCIVLPISMKENKLEEMVSESCYNEIVTKLKEQVGEAAFQYIFPAIKKAIEDGSGKVREEILINWLDVDSCRVCSECGKIMQEGWYNMGKYACSDECVMKQDGITKEEFDRYQIYKATIEAQLEEGQNIEDLTKEEIDQILESVLEDCDAYYTEWY